LPHPLERAEKEQGHEARESNSADTALETARAILAQCGISSHSVRHKAHSLAEAIEIETNTNLYNLIVVGSCTEITKSALPILLLPCQN
jgi:diphthamide biosynthesis methyltransferase